MSDEAGRNRIKLIISDFHLSRGRWLPDGRRNPLEDFHQDEKFEEFLDHYSQGEFAGSEVELIINGDFFDPLAVVPLQEGARWRMPKLEFPVEVEEVAAVRQFRTILEGHPICVRALRSFLSRGKRIVIRWGNHDAALLWADVQKLLREELRPPSPGQLEFQLEPYVFDRICVDHGHQYETIHQFDLKNIFIERKFQGAKRLIQNLPFGSFFVLDFLNRIKLERHYINQVHPFGAYLRLSLFLQPIVTIRDSMRVAWFFVKMRFITHPLRFARLPKTLLIMKEIFRRPSLEGIAEDMLTGAGNERLPFDTLIMGHNHQPTIRTFPGGKQYLNTGTWTPITSLDMGSLGHRVLRTYALIEYSEGKPRASLKVWHGHHSPTDDFN